MSSNAIMLTSTNPHFPVALRSGTLLAPCPQIWALGNLDILAIPLLGFFCATRCPGDVILRTYDLALALREASVPVIGGFHTPMERSVWRHYCAASHRWRSALPAISSVYSCQQAPVSDTVTADSSCSHR